MTDRMEVYTDGVLNVADGTVLRGDTAFRIIDYRNDTWGDIGAATFDDVSVYFYNTGASFIAGANVTMNRDGNYKVVSADGTLSVGVSNVTVTDSTDGAGTSSGV
ncbi:MAG: hypothetical protein ACJA1R_001795 [Flavobacteriales bacterium]|jgi:hypothetical protein